MSRKRWSWAVGEYGNRVLVFEERNGRLYGQIRGTRRALKHTDRKRAKSWAKDQEKKLRDGLAHAGDPTPTLAKVFAAYEVAQRDVDKSSRSRGEDKRCAEMFTRVLGAGRDLSKLTLGEWQHFINARQTGAIDAAGQVVPEPRKPEDVKRRGVRARAVEADCEWLLKVCNWATEWEDRDTGQVLLREHPLRRERFRKAVPHEQNPRRPVATQDRYEAIMAKAGAVHPFLPFILTITNGTGRRISPVLGLRYHDLQLVKTQAVPHGAIAWPGETDKMGKAWSAPINATVRTTLDRLLAERPGVGAAYLFPSLTDAAKPVDRWMASKWLRRAERLAEVPKHKGSLWHAYRRKWGTERKHLPIQDVAQAGGWKNAATLQTIYQQTDEATLYRVVSEPAELRETPPYSPPIRARSMRERRSRYVRHAR